MKRKVGMAVCIALTAATMTSMATKSGTKMKNDMLAPAAKGTIELTAKKKRSRRNQVTDANGNGIVRSKKTGAIAHVSAAYAPKFQSYIDDLESYGAKILFIGGIRRGRCSPGHQHPCGKALDVCQLSRGVVDSRCNLPGKVIMSAIAMKNGLFEGALWCDGDYGHAQVSISAEACRKNLYAAVKRFKETLVANLDPTTAAEAKVYDYSQVATAVDVQDAVKQHQTRTYAARKHRYHRRYYANKYRIRESRQAAYAMPNVYDTRWSAGQ